MGNHRFEFEYRTNNQPTDWSDEVVPRRGIAPGRSMGLSLILNVKEDEYYCSGTESVGFKVPS